MKSKILMLIIVIIILSSISYSIKIDPLLEEKISKEGSANIIIKFKEPQESIIAERSIKESLSVSKKLDTKQKEQIKKEVKFELENKKKVIKQSQQKVLKNLDNIKTKKGTLKERINIDKKFLLKNAISGKIDSETLNELAKSPEIESIYLDREAKKALNEANPIIKSNDVWKYQINEMNLSGKGQSVCIIDTGIDSDHPAFSGRIVAQHCFCSVSDHGSGGCCPDATTEDTSAEDDEDHGTHCAGIAAGNQSGLRGVANEAGIVAVKALDNSGSGSFSDIAASIEWCIDNREAYNISAISMSLGDGAEWNNPSVDCASTYLTASYIDLAVSSGISVFVASGNENFSNGISYPACVSSAISVGSTQDGSYSTTVDKVSYFTNIDEILDLMAPGQWITSTIIGGTGVMQGTSMATPMVAGASLLIYQYANMHNLSITPEQMRQIFKNTGTNVTDEGLTFPRIDVYESIKSIDSDSPEVFFIRNTPNNNTQTYNTSIEINVSSNDFFNNITSCIFNWNGTENFSMNITKIGKDAECYINKSINGSGKFYYKIFSSDIKGNLGVSNNRYITINNTAPSIDEVFPNHTIINISEPQNQSFRINSSDINSDNIQTYWYLNHNLVSIGENYTFIGNYSSNQTYNITGIVTDNKNNSTYYWILNVSNTNRIPTVNTFINSDKLSNNTYANLSCNYSYSDLDNESIKKEKIIWYKDNIIQNSLENFSLVRFSNTSKNQTWKCLVAAYDGHNWSNYKNSSGIYITNSIPNAEEIENISVNETDRINITINASDDDLDALLYSINDSRFSLVSNTFFWDSNTSSSSEFKVTIQISDGEENVTRYANISIIDRNDLDNDGIIDIYDNDDDNDGINDSKDYLVGNISTINSSENIKIYVNNSENITKEFNNSYKVNITDNNNKTILYFNWNFTNKKLYFNFTIDKNDSEGIMMVKGLDLSLNSNKKTIYVNKSDSSHNYVCILDKEVNSKNDITNDCSGALEIKVACPGSSLSYSCSLENNNFKVSGLDHSLVKGIYVAPAPTPIGGGGGGSSYSTKEECRDGIDNDNDGFIDFPDDLGCESNYDDSEYDLSEEKCNEDWTCSSWSECIDGIQIRECADWNECGTKDWKPKLSQECMQENIQEENKNISTNNKTDKKDLYMNFKENKVNEEKTTNTNKDIKETLTIKTKAIINNILGIISISLILGSIASVIIHEKFNFSKNKKRGKK